ncbi:MAG: ATP-binding cassette domain-containing protein [Desulfovibrionaceae bacterium]|nr:ATP-binding cassette domain-containing protein [Desulfovibrionaceae bacterium]
MRETPVVISLRGIVNRFGDQAVHDGLDLEVRQGEIFGLIGGSGSGKSVLLRTIVGLHKPQAGEVRVLGTDLIRASHREWEKVRRQWGVLFQDGALFSSLTVKENIQAPLRRFADLPPADLDRLAAMKIAMSGLSPDSFDKYPAALSGGMRKRAGIARALALDPALLFLDEPTAGLDPMGAEALDSLILTLSRSLGLTVFLVTHDLDTLVTVCDRVAVLMDGNILAVGGLDELAKMDNEWLRAYFGGPRGRALAKPRG